MGGWDVNCAFCGASFSNFNAFEEGAYDPAIITEAGKLTTTSLLRWK